MSSWHKTRQHNVADSGSLSYETHGGKWGENSQQEFCKNTSRVYSENNSSRSQAIRIFMFPFWTCPNCESQGWDFAVVTLYCLLCLFHFAWSQCLALILTRWKDHRCEPGTVFFSILTIFSLSGNLSIWCCIFLPVLVQSCGSQSVLHSIFSLRL